MDTGDFLGFYLPQQRVTKLLATDDVALADGMGRVDERVRLLEHTVMELSVTLAALGAALQAHGGIDLAAVQATASAELIKLRARGPVVTCSSCGRTVAERLTVLRADAVVCDVCDATSGQ